MKTFFDKSQLFVYPTSRKVRQEIEKYSSENIFLPKIITIEEFENSLLSVKNKRIADKDERKFILYEACKFKEFEELKIDLDNLAFLDNSEYILSFLQECALEKKEPLELLGGDIYGEYENHLILLNQIKGNYESLMDSRGLFDKITLPKEYQIGTSYLQSFDSIDIFIEGYPSTFELEILKKASLITPIFIHIVSSVFNQKIVKKFIGASNAKIDNFYTINLSNETIVIENKLDPIFKKTKFFTADFKNRAMQIAFIKSKIEKFIKKGIKPEEIVVILPDEEFAKTLYLFDLLRNFNFAMGFNFSDTVSFKKLQAIYKYLKEMDNTENIYRLKRFGVDKDLLNQIFQKDPLDAFDEILKIINSDQKDEKEILENEIYSFKKIFVNILNDETKNISANTNIKIQIDRNIKLSDLLKIFLQRLSKRKLDDSKGGKITVMGVLEARGIEFKAVIIPDFNNEFVPKRSQKDLFLSTKTREISGLPTAFERQELQKYYYQRLFQNAKYVAISYVKNEQSDVSGLFEEFGIHKVAQKIIGDFSNVLSISPVFSKIKDLDEIICKYNFLNNPLSSSKLRIFLECKRKFYYKYIKNIKETSIPSSLLDKAQIGNILHEGLKNLYLQYGSFSSVQMHHNLLKNEIIKLKNCDFESDLALDIWIEKLKIFSQNEYERFMNDQIRVFALENRFESKFEGFELEGKIDRIDLLPDGRKIILDYKSSKVSQPSKPDFNKLVDFQLPFYYLLTQNLGEIEGAYYYDLNDGKLKKDYLIKEKIELLKEKLILLKEEEFNFLMCEELQTCKFCPYKIMCGREDV